MNSSLRGQPVRFTTTFAGTTATNLVTNATDNTKTDTVTQTITPRTVVLPGGFYGAYEALAARLSSMNVGDSIALYVAPTGELQASLDAIVPHQIATPAARASRYREFDLTVKTVMPQTLRGLGGRAQPARADRPARRPSVAVARDDLADRHGARGARPQRRRHQRRSSRSPGFTVGATVTVPPSAAPAPAVRHPAVVLVPGFGPEDRDEVMGNVPVFGLLAGHLADAGYLVVRYDRRGVGQSGGRPENATLEDYRDDLLEVIRSVRQRKDVDGDRIAVIGYQDGGAVAMLAAAKDDAVMALGLAAVPGTSAAVTTSSSSRRARSPRCRSRRPTGRRRFSSSARSSRHRCRELGGAVAGRRQATAPTSRSTAAGCCSTRPR